MPSVRKIGGMAYEFLSREELEGVLRANATWEVDQDEAKAREYVAVASAMLALPVTEFDHAGERVRLDIRILQENMLRAARWLANRKRFRYGRARYADVSNFREHGGGHVSE